MLYKRELWEKQRFPTEYDVAEDVITLYSIFDLCNLVYAMVALELVLGIVTFDKGAALSSIAGGLIRLILAGSIGLAVHEKYVDKAKRGTR